MVELEKKSKPKYAKFLETIDSKIIEVYGNFSFNKAFPNVTSFDDVIEKEELSSELGPIPIYLLSDLGTYKNDLERTNNENKDYFMSDKVNGFLYVGNMSGRSYKGYWDLGDKPEMTGFSFKYGLLHIIPLENLVDSGENYLEGFFNHNFNSQVYGFFEMRNSTGCIQVYTQDFKEGGVYAAKHSDRYQNTKFGIIKGVQKIIQRIIIEAPEQYFDSKAAIMCHKNDSILSRC